MRERVNHREKRRREQRAAATRRRFLIGGTAIGVLGLGALVANSFFSGSGDTDFAKFLNDLNRRTKDSKGLDLLSQKAQEIAEKALEVSSQYLGTSPTKVGENIRFFTNDSDFRRTMVSSTICPNGSIPQGVEATTTISSVLPRTNPQERIGILLRTDVKSPATEIAEKAIHEDLHLRTTTRDFKPEDMTPLMNPFNRYLLVDGLKILYFAPEDRIDPCNPRILRSTLLESVYQYSTLEVLRSGGIRLGMGGYDSEMYKPLTARYAANIGHLFSEDHKDQLLIPCLQSDPSKYFKNLGLRLSPRDPNPAYSAEKRTTELYR